ncbi:DMT family transporter [Delftia acidovorans]|uniref:DMT family transporter n=1 Tax=Delftia acidovorans TaxID=80866 RepID=A0A7T2S4V2_DELAC|nr:DMT family transporter [Delftia acidovorans]QPS08828.1 DMT family transporter [Delftia acidovorans]
MTGRNTILAMAPVGMALLAGAILPFQAASNAMVGRLLGHPLWGALTSLAVSVMVVVPALWAMRAPTPAVAQAAAGPWWLWIGGVLGAIYVASAAAVTPKLGAGGFLVCVVAGQIVVSVLVDHFGLMGLGARPVNWSRLAGGALILGGVFLVVQGGQVKEPAGAGSAAAQR